MRGAGMFHLLGVALGLAAAGVGAAKPNVVRVQILSQVRAGQHWHYSAHTYGSCSVSAELSSLSRDLVDFASRCQWCAAFS